MSGDSPALREKIIDLKRDRPMIKCTEIAKLTGASRGYVSRVLTKAGLTASHNRARILVPITPENLSWVASEAEALGVDTSEVIDAVLTDARMEA